MGGGAWWEEVPGGRRCLVGGGPGGRRCLVGGGPGGRRCLLPKYEVWIRGVRLST